MIRRAARDLFSQKGYHAVTLADIAEATDQSIGTVYYAYSKKERILLDIVIGETSSVYGHIFQDVQEIVDPLERFDAIVRGLYRAMDEASKVFVILYKDLPSVDKETRSYILSLEKRTAGKLIELIEEGKRSRHFSQEVPSKYIAFNVLGLGHLWALKKTWYFEREISLSDYTEAQLQLFHSSLLPYSS